jgi:hypothetical protein
MSPILTKRMYVYLTTGCECRHETALDDATRCISDDIKHIWSDAGVCLCVLGMYPPLIIVFVSVRVCIELWHLTTLYIYLLLGDESL